MSDNKPPYPIPPAFVTDVEMALQDIPNREDTVYRLRRLFGRIYAEGHSDGWLAAQVERNYDKHAPKEPE